MIFNALALSIAHLVKTDAKGEVLTVDKNGKNPTAEYTIKGKKIENGLFYIIDEKKHDIKVSKAIYDAIP